MPTATTMNITMACAPEEPSCAPPTYHRAAGKEALAALAPALDRIDGTQVASVRVNVQMATYAALGVAAFVTSPEVRPRFADLPAKEFDIEHLDGLQPACFAMLHAHSEALAAGALEEGGRLPASLAAEAAELEARMQAVCEYQLADDPAIGPELARLRPGIGYRDLANDLLGYARIYELRADALQADKKNYRDGDAERAEQIAGKILRTFSVMTPRARAAFDLYARVWTLLTGRYDEVRAAGLWLFRNDPRADQRFPSLYAAGRPGAGRPRKAGAKDPAVEGDGSGVAAGSGVGGGGADGAGAVAGGGVAGGGVEATPA